MSLAAQRLSLSGDVVRERNFYREGDTTHYGQRVEDANRIEIIWTRLKETSRFEGRRARLRASTPATRTRNAASRSHP